MRRSFRYLPFALPLLLPIVALIRQLFLAESWSFDELSRWSHLASNTVALVGLTLLLAMPPGIFLALVLFRTNFPFRGFFRGLLLVSLFVPLPVYVSAWQMAFGPTGWLAPEFASTSGVWKPWHEGLVSAAIVHALAALPWVVFFVGLALDQVEVELEEEGLMHTSAWRTLFRISLRRIRPSLGFVALVLALQTAGEIAVTDVMLVRTFAEEVYNQYVLDRDALAPLILLTVPQTLLLLWLFHIPPRPSNGTWLSVLKGQSHPSLGQPPRLSWIAFLPTALLLLLYVGIPFLSLLRRASGDTFSPQTLFASLWRTFAGSQWLILESLLWAFLVGFAATALALGFGAWALASTRRQSLLIAFSILLLSLPSPVLGFGVKGAIDLVLDFEEWVLGWQTYLPLRLLLYDLPSPLPVIWCQTVKFFPLAVGLLLPAMNRLPRELRDELRLAGASRWAAFRLLWWPSLRGMLMVSILAVSLFALSEISASKLVEVPGRVTFAHELFRQMHYGANSTVAAFCLLEVALAGIASILLFTILTRRSSLS